ncbi:MAG: rod shape-determining protein RodA [Thermodesulfobacteriota bacterium]
MAEGEEGKKQVDWGILVPVFLLGIIGIMTIFSAAASETPDLQKRLCLKQAMWFAGSMMMILFFLFFNYKRLFSWAEGIYIVSIVLLIAVLLLGREAGGARRWLPLGPISVQPSEMMKMALVIIIAKYYSQKSITGGLTLRHLIVPMVLTAVPFGLILVQPDLGTAMLLVLITAFMTGFVKVRRRTVLVFGGALIAAAPLIWMFLLKSYQKLRVLTFLNPDRDPLGAGYHIIQSKIAIGSGMLFGKGYMKGTQNALAFLPEQHTDFIFSVLAEEWGLVGAGAVLLLYLFVIVWGIGIAYKCKDPFGIILSVGAIGVIFWQVVINVGMVMGLMPVVGVPLPLISYGGSSVLTFMMAIGVLMNISMKRTWIE